MKKILSSTFAVLLFVSFAAAQQQKAEAVIGLNEQFFDVFLDSVFQNLQKPEFIIGEKENNCEQKLTVHREMNGTKTAVRFRKGKITAPLAFTGNYDMPLVGCINFAGWADTNVNLEFDQNNQILFGRVTVTDVRLNNVPSMAGGVLAKLVQGSIDKRINPVEILRTNNLSFLIPVQQSGNLRLKPVGIRHEVSENLLNIYVAFNFLKE